MAGHLNRATIIGNLGRNPEVRITHSGSPIVSFSVATTESWKDKVSGEKKERTNWHNVVIFNEPVGKIAEQYLKKGSKVMLEGSIETRKYQGKDGEDRYTTEIVIRPYSGNLILMGDSGGSNRPPPHNGDDGSSDSLSDQINDDIPF